MFSSTSSISEDCNPLSKDSPSDTSASSSDSGIFVKKLKKSPMKRGICCNPKGEINEREDEPEKYFQTKNNWNKNDLKKRHFKQSSPKKSGSFTSEEYLETVSKLQWLVREENELKIAIAYGKLRKEQPVFVDADQLREKIFEQKKLLEEARNEQKIKTVMCTNLQFANTLQKINRFSHKTKGGSYSETQKACIQQLLKKKKELNRDISTKRQEIAEIDETILKLKKNIADFMQRTSQLTADGSSVSDDIKENNDDKLKRLMKSNEKFGDRIHVLARINQSLATYLAKGSTKDENLTKLISECEKVSRCTFDNSNDIEALLNSVCSINL